MDERDFNQETYEENTKKISDNIQLLKDTLNKTIGFNWYIGINDENIILTNKESRIKLKVHIFMDKAWISTPTSCTTLFEFEFKKINEVADKVYVYTTIMMASFNKYKEFVNYCINEIKDLDSIYKNIPYMNPIDYDFNLNTNELVIRFEKLRYVAINLSFELDDNCENIIPVIYINNSSIRTRTLFYLNSMNYKDVWKNIKFYL